jgi:ABC-type transporter Mla MlaB component
VSTFVLKGDVSRDVAALFVEQLASVTSEDAPLTLDMREADVEDTHVTALLIEGIRQAALRVKSVQLLEPPQVLAHGLYRVGALAPTTAIHVVDPRSEIPTSS